MLLFTPFRQQVKIHAKFASQMDFYLQYICFRTDLAVNAKSCMNSNELVPKKYGSSTGIGFLIGRYKKASRLAVPLYIENPNFAADKILNLSGIYSLIPKAE